VIDMRVAREQTAEVRAALGRKGSASAFDELMDADAVWRGAQAGVDTLRSRTRLKSRPTPEQLEEQGQIKEELKAAEQELGLLEERRTSLLLAVPNLPDPSAPDGMTEADAVVVREVGKVPEFGFTPRDHVDLGGFDLERGARLSGSRFVYRLGAAAQVELALYRFAIDRLLERGFTLVLPPVLVREEAMVGTGFLPTEEMNIYRLEGDELYLTGTSEVALAGFHLGEILPEGSLPLRYAGYSTCFRREAGAAGRDTKGIFRVHQFDKVEMFAFTTPDRSAEEHEAILEIEESIVRQLGVAYRVVNIAAGDLGPSAAKKYDIEAWIPSEGRYREITSCSNTTDYQSRRLKIRYRDEGRELAHPHTLNGTAMTARLLIALMETHQDADGRVAVPEVLRPFGAPVSITPPAGREP
jgi:seryl-tRNA synthetase